MVQTFLKIFDYFRRNTRSLYLLLTLCVILLAGGLFLLHFDEDVSGFLATGKEHERIGYAYRNIGGSNKIIVSIAMTDQTGETDHGLLMDAADHLAGLLEKEPARQHIKAITYKADPCLLYTSDAADDLLCVDLGGRRIIKKKKPLTYNRMAVHHNINDVHHRGTSPRVKKVTTT